MPVSPQPIDTEGLRFRLAREIDGEVYFDTGERALYATDASNYRQMPIGVVIPKTLEAVEQTVALCRDFGAPVTNRGAATSLAGQTCNEAVIIDMSKYLKRIVDIDRRTKTATVQPGLVLDDLNIAAGEHDLIFGPDPATHTHCTIGGMLGNNACGIHAQMAGRMDLNVEALEILTYRGERFWVGPVDEAELAAFAGREDAKGRLYRELMHLREVYATDIRTSFPQIPRRVSGYNLEALLSENRFHVARALVGSESTCVTVLQAKLKLLDRPKVRRLCVIGFDDVIAAARFVPELLPFQPIGLEAVDNELYRSIRGRGLSPEAAKLLPKGEAWLYLELGGEEGDVRERTEKLRKYLGSSARIRSYRLIDDENESEQLWTLRESGLAATARLPGGQETWEGWEDAAVPPEKLADYLLDFRRLLARYEYRGALYGHFGQGCVHTRINFDLRTRAGIARFDGFIKDAADLVTEYGGSLSGEHGDGQARGALLEKMYSSDVLDAFRRFKSIWDPDWKMNPGKLIDADRPTQNLRFGAEHHPLGVETHFRYPEDDHSFSRAVDRCVGVGQCRKTSSAIMCPSYRATGDERHSTRGRARLLFEMLSARDLRKQWREKPVKEALDLCLSCKACKKECPVNVDMATYKSEFYSHYFRGRLRPRSAYSMGWIRHWAEIAGRMPGLVNFLGSAPVTSTLVKWIGGISSERELPRFAGRPFTDDFTADENATGSEVILWPDTFNNYFQPEILRAAADVLAHCGFAVRLPSEPLCCGRPLYDFGFLNKAKKHWLKILRSLREDIRAGVPIVGLEPSCVAAFRDELRNLFPQDWDAKRLSGQVFTLGEFLSEHRAFSAPYVVGREIFYHGHCHHRSVMGIESDVALLKRLGMGVTVPDTGCCGMAGAFGFEREKYEISMEVAKTQLLPHLEKKAPTAELVADGFSCREQIRHLTGRRPLHSAEILKAWMEAGNGK